MNDRSSLQSNTSDNTNREHSRLCKCFQPYVFACFGVIILLQAVVFYATRIPLRHMVLHDMSTVLDKKIPFRPEWVSVYFLAYLTWIFGAVLIISENRASGYRFTAAYSVALIISGIVFLVYPCTLERPAIVEGGFFADWVRFLYRVDSPTNLCPSLHVMANYFCWRGSVSCKTLPKWYRLFNLVFLVLVCFSILFVKQHVLIDIAPAVLIAELSLRCAEFFKLERIPLLIEPTIKK